MLGRIKFKDALESSFDDDVAFDDLNKFSDFSCAVDSALKKIGVTDLDVILDHQRKMIDALDHIKRICNSARTPTKRLDWVVARCKMALLGEDWNRDYAPLPNSIRDTEVEDLREALRNSQELLKQHIPEKAEEQIKTNDIALNEPPGTTYKPGRIRSMPAP